MHRLHALLRSLAFVALGTTAHASDVTVNVNVPAFSTGPQVAQLFENAWSQSGDFSCMAVKSRLQVRDLSGDCDEDFSWYTFFPQVNATS